ncbi:MAG: OsmC family peroxiredoxin [Thermoleophilia bacterium]|nr:OsmC family peroxiredoxin [Thermoleophilia bacterium]GIK77637.1 MAG: peroxiredoxin [Actinomycetes bacterium]
MAGTGHARWSGDLEGGRGTIESGTGALAGEYSAASRFADGAGTNPEELIAAAHAGCFSMALSLVLGEAGHVPDSIDTDARVHIRRGDHGFEIHRIELETTASVPGIDDAAFQRLAAAAKQGCPVSKALASVPEITLEARLAG